MRQIRSPTLWIAPLVLSLTLVVACAGPKFSTHRYTPVSRSVGIAADTERISYGPEVVSVFRGDTVMWFLEEPGSFDEFEIDLKQHTPAYQRWIRVSATDTARAVIRLSANGGMYGYSITLRAGVRLFDIHPELQVRTRANNR